MKPRLTPHFMLFFLRSLKDFFKKLITYNSLLFLFMKLPTPYTLWERLTEKENKRTVGEKSVKNKPYKLKGLYFHYLFFFYIENMLIKKIRDL